MKQDFRDKWVAALRSGEYKQGSGSLHVVNGDTHEWCCVGVACDVLIGMGATIPHGLVFEDGNVYHYDAQCEMVSYASAIMIGLEHGKLRTLAAMNDGDNELLPSTFMEIADYIEKELPVDGW